jgi:hypothetical protein
MDDPNLALPQSSRKACGDRLEEAGAGYEPNAVPVASGRVPHDQPFVVSRFIGCQAQKLTRFHSGKRISSSPELSVEGSPSDKSAGCGRELCSDSLKQVL